MASLQLVLQSGVSSHEHLETDKATQRSGGFLQGFATYLIFGSFVVFTAPLCYLVLRDENFFQQHQWLVFGYAWLLGSTHFVITLTVYLQSANLRYFNSSWKNRFCYFAVPILILLGFDPGPSVGPYRGRGLLHTATDARDAVDQAAMLLEQRP